MKTKDEVFNYILEKVLPDMDDVNYDPGDVIMQVRDLCYDGLNISTLPSPSIKSPEAKTVFVPVSVKERVPDDSEAHIVCITEGVYKTYKEAWLHNDKETWEFDGNEIKNITHWLEETNIPQSQNIKSLIEKRISELKNASNVNVSDTGLFVRREIITELKMLLTSITK